MKSNLRKPQARPSSPMRTAKHVLLIILLTFQSSAAFSVVRDPLDPVRDCNPNDRRSSPKIVAHRGEGADEDVSRVRVSSSDDKTASTSTVLRCSQPRKASLFPSFVWLTSEVGDQRKLEGSFEFESAFRTEPSEDSCSLSKPYRSDRSAAEEQIPREMEPQGYSDRGGDERSVNTEPPDYRMPGGVTRTGPDRNTFRVTRTLLPNGLNFTTFSCPIYTCQK